MTERTDYAWPRRVDDAAAGAAARRLADSAKASAAGRRRIVFLINSLTGGGAERVMSVLLAGLEEALAGDEVHLVLLDREAVRHTMPPYVRIHQLDARFSLPRSIRLLHTTLRRLSPDVVVSFLERSNVANVVCGGLLGYPSVVCEHTYTSAHLGSGVSGLLKRLAVRLTYPRAAKVIAVSAGTRDDLVRNFAVPAARIEVIHNPVDRDRLLAMSRGERTIDTPTDYAVAVGRLVPDKNFALLIEAVARIPGLNLVLLGVGPERERLERLVREKRLTDRVSMPGYIENPFPIIAGASFFVSSSNVEGFPMSILEAMSLGRPIVAAECPGLAEALSGKRPDGTTDHRRDNGILVPMNDIDALAGALREMADPAVREAYSRKALDRARAFDAQSACRLYLQAIDALVDRGA